MEEHVPLVGPALGPRAQRTLASAPLQNRPDGRLTVRLEVSVQEMAFQNWLQLVSLDAVRTLDQFMALLYFI